MLRLACASCTDHDTHSLICSAQAPQVSESEQNSSLPLLCDVSELGKNAYSWLVATCDALWLACLSVMCRRSIDTWAWAAFCVLVYCWVFTSFPLILHLRPLLTLFTRSHILLSVVSRPLLLFSPLSLSLSRKYLIVIQLLSYSSCLPVSLWINFSLPFFILLIVFSQSEGWQTFTNDSLLFNTDSACSDSYKSKVMSSCVSHKSFIPLIFLCLVLSCLVLSSF